MTGAAELPGSFRRTMQLTRRTWPITRRTPTTIYSIERKITMLVNARCLGRMCVSRNTLRIETKTPTGFNGRSDVNRRNLGRLATALPDTRSHLCVHDRDNYTFSTDN